jgi:hypothetical protein
MNPSTEDLLQAVESVDCSEVIILPNNRNIVMAAEQACTLSEKAVEVVRTTSVPQGISALLALNYQADMATNIQVMTESAQDTETAEITTAVRSVQIDGIPVQEGEVIGLVNGKLTVRGASPEQVTHDVLAAMQVDNYEIITLYYGESISADVAQELADQIEERFPEQEVEVVDGGQPHYYYILSAE